MVEKPKAPPVPIQKNPKRIETHGGHQKMVIRDVKTGQYVSKR